jgi:hypothetical protein
MIIVSRKTLWKVQKGYRDKIFIIGNENYFWKLLLDKCYTRFKKILLVQCRVMTSKKCHDEMSYIYNLKTIDAEDYHVIFYWRRENVISECNFKSLLNILRKMFLECWINISLACFIIRMLYKHSSFAGSLLFSNNYK